MRLIRYAVILVTAAYWVFLCVMTHLPAQDLPHVQLDDKVEHFLAFGCLAGLLGLTCWVLFPRRKWLVWSVLVIGMVYGALDEQTQKLIPSRSCDFEDWVADACGTIAGILPVVVMQRFVRLPAGRKNRPPVEMEPDVLSPELDAALDAIEDPAAPPLRARRVG